MSLLASLPAPRHQHAAPSPQQAVQPSTTTALAVVGGREAPPYPRRKGFVPRRQEDFNDGGAYPELPLLQYPLDMGRSDEQKGNKTLAVSVDINGNANYDAILRQGARANKVIHSGHQALVPKIDLLTQPEVSAWVVLRSCSQQHKSLEPDAACSACLTCTIHDFQQDSWLIPVCRHLHRHQVAGKVHSLIVC